jgi:hypothetical protein
MAIILGGRDAFAKTVDLDVGVGWNIKDFRWWTTGSNNGNMMLAYGQQDSDNGGILCRRNGYIL